MVQKLSGDDAGAVAYDLLVVGGGINGCGIARDAAGRGLRVLLVEKNDLAEGTSSRSTKLFHGGLRYLEYFEFRLVREALIEREVLLRAMPHIAWPMRFVLPFHKEMRFESTTPASRLLARIMPWAKGRRPAWMIRLGLFLYDHLGGRKILPATKTLDLARAPEGDVLQARFAKAFEYSDVWVQDARAVVLNARDAEAKGASVQTYTELVLAKRQEEHWQVTLRDFDTGTERDVTAKMIVNAAGPWVERLLTTTLRLNEVSDKVRLVRGSHIVTRKLYAHDKCYFFQGTDGRIIFAIPYEEDFTLIGTTDAEHHDPDIEPHCTDEERDYLLDFANNYFRQPLSAADVVWSYAGVRPLHDDGAASASAASRDYTLRLDQNAAPLLSVFGGKITTYRRLAESALEEIGKVFAALPAPWTAQGHLPGGDFDPRDTEAQITNLQKTYPFLDAAWAKRLIRHYGTEAAFWLGNAQLATDLGKDFGATLTEAEVNWLMTHEYARKAEDVVWRRTKLGLRMSDDQIAHLGQWMAENAPR